MTIDRGPWNALVDDDGSNLTGSVWNKAAIKTVILDPVDAALPASMVWTPVAFNVANFPNLPGLTAGKVTLNQYTVSGKTLFWMLQLAAATVPSPVSQAIEFMVPGGVSVSGCNAPLSYGVDAGVGVTGVVLPITATKLGAYKALFTNWNGPTCYCYFSLTAALV